MTQPDDQGNLQQIIQEYQQVVGDYEKINDLIQNLLMSYGGNSENMPNDALDHYRKLARERDELLNHMRWLEQNLLESQDDEDV